MSDEDLFSFGIGPDGKPLPVPGDEVFEDLTGRAARTRGMASMLDLASRRRDEAAADGNTFGLAQTEADADPNDLSVAGWGILFGRSVSKDIKDALKPLIELRRSQGASPLKIFEQGEPGKDEDVYQWMQDRGVSLNPVDPSLGVPYYLLIVASPEEISFEFQYVLDVYWAVGRLWFDTPAEFKRYAESLVKYEDPAHKPRSKRRIALFAPEHDFDKATQLFTSQVAKPLCGIGTASDPIGKRLKYGLKPLLGSDATRVNYGSILRGTIDGGPPALLFSGGHGMQFNDGDEPQLTTQGALVCQDWPSYGAVTDQHWFSAADVPGDAQVHGLMYFMFACHGGGVPQFDNFDRLNNKPKQIAPRPFFSKLPQALLAHQNGGALAVLAHIERAWAFGFQGDGGIPQIQGFRGVLSLLLRGDRIGQATDTFNMNWATNNIRLTEAQFARDRDPSLPIAPIKRFWIRRDDARNFMILGDPAARLRAGELSS